MSIVQSWSPTMSRFRQCPRLNTQQSWSKVSCTKQRPFDVHRGLTQVCAGKLRDSCCKGRQQAAGACLQGPQERLGHLRHHFGCPGACCAGARPRLCSWGLRHVVGSRPCIWEPGCAVCGAAVSYSPVPCHLGRLLGLALGSLLSQALQLTLQGHGGRGSVTECLLQ